MIVHIARAHELEEAKRSGEYVPGSFATDGFIHLSDLDTVHLPANALYANTAGLVLLWVEPARLTAELRYEQGFPHLYGPLNLDAVVDETPLEPWERGGFRLPPRSQL